MTRGRRAVRATTEESLTLDLASPATHEALDPRRARSGSWRWSSHGVEIGSIGYVWRPATAAKAAKLHLNSCVNGEPVEQVVHFDVSRPHFGGERLWFLCPLAERTGTLWRVRALYLPPSARFWGSRKAYGLSYQSQRDCGLERSLVRVLGRDGGHDPSADARSFSAVDAIAALKEERWFFDRLHARSKRNAIRRIKRERAREQLHLARTWHDFRRQPTKLRAIARTMP